MTTFTIEESGMTFGPFERDDCFEVEACAAYKKIEPHGVKIAEFVWLPPDRKSAQMWIVEAKTGAPRELSKFVPDVRDKFIDTLTMIVCACLGRPDTAHGELPSSFGTLNLAGVQPRFVLVVRALKDQHLDQLAAKLRSDLRPSIKTWGISSPAIIVMNEASARKKNLIQ